MRPSSSSNSRPARLMKINKDSHSIHKPSSASSSSTTATSLVSNDYRADPVIIYTHSPKVIHTEACDFMALVQKLTGMSSDVGGPTGDSSNYEDPPPPAAAAVAMPLQQPQSFDGSYNSNVVSCNSSIASNPLAVDATSAAAAAVVPEDFHVMKADWTECLMQEESPYFTYQDMSSEINSPALAAAAANGWMHPGFGYGSLEDQDSLF